MIQYKKITVFSYNIHKGWSPLGRKLTLLDIKKLILKYKPDFVFLQEVVGSHMGKKYLLLPEGDTSVQFEFFADELWPNYAYGKNAIYKEGHHGNCLLSKYPISNWRNIDLSTNKRERRGLLHAQVKIPEFFEPLDLLCTHLNLLENGRKIQIEKIINYINEYIPTQLPCILAGDFNDWRQRITEKLYAGCHLEEANLKLQGKYKKTFPSIFPLVSLDRFYYRGVNPLGTKVLPEALSDHLPLIACFNIPIPSR